MSQPTTDCSFKSTQQGQAYLGCSKKSREVSVAEVEWPGGSKGEGGEGDKLGWAS